MANEHTIQTFSAADIEKYHKGLLADKDRHALEKAALDDPFLADALEGYAVPGVNAAADISELKKRLAERQEQDQAKLVALTPGGKKSIPWLRIAAMLVVLAGAGWLVYQLGFKQPENIAQTPAADSKKNAIKKEYTVTPLTTDSNQYKEDTTTTVTFKKTDPSPGGAPPAASDSIAGLTATDELSATISSSAVEKKKQPQPSLPARPVEQESINQAEETALAKKDKENTAKAAEQRKLSADNKERRAIPGENGYNNNNDALANNNAARNNYQGIISSNVFRGRVTDQQNNALPFANITNPVDNIGTYADANGNFTITSPDSVLDVQVRSVGFENNTVQLRNSLLSNQVYMQEDQSISARVLDTTTRIANRSRYSNMILEEPEPADGWRNYDTYVANNLNVPEEFTTKQSGETEVELSFEVNKLGQPINIKVVKSLCETCDKEAIRLIKEGPKWKRKGNKKRTTVKVAF